jgi:hypothetical protein
VQFGIGRHLYGSIPKSLLGEIRDEEPAENHSSDGHGGSDYQFLRGELEGCNTLDDLKEAWGMVREAKGRLEQPHFAELEAVKDARKVALG